MRRRTRVLDAALRSLPEDRPPAVVFPLLWTGLTVVRALRTHGVPVVALDPAPRRAAAYTRLCRTLVAPEQELWETLYELGDRLAGRDPVLFFTADHDAVRGSLERDELATRFRFRFPPPEVYTLLVDKLEFAEFALRHELPIPQTFVVRAGEGWDAVLATGAYPLVVKPKYRSAEWEEAGLDKVYKVESREELDELLRLVPRIEGDYVVQKWIPGADAQLYFHVTYFGADGEPLSGFTARKLRQWPPLVGSSTVQVPVERPEVERESVRLLRLAGLRGLGSVEFKEDPRDGRLVIMEPSVGRATMGGGVAVANGANLYYRAYCDLAGVEPEPEPARPPTRWILVENDLLTLLARSRNGGLTLRRFLGAYRGPRVYGDFAWRDPLPLLVGLAGLARDLCSRLVLPRRRPRRRGLVTTAAPEGGSS